MQIIKTINFIVRDKKWMAFQLSNIAFLTVMNFLVIFLNSKEYTLQETYIFFLSLSILNFTFMNILEKYIFFKEKYMTLILGGVFVGLSIISYIYNDSNIYIYLYMFSILSLMLFNNLFSINGISNIQDKFRKRKFNIDEKLITATAPILTILIISLILPIVGFASDFNTDFLILFPILMVLVAIRYSLKINKNNNKKKSNIKYKKINTRKNNLNKMYFLAFFMNSISIMIKNICIPMFFIVLAERNGFDNSLFKYFGLFLAFFAIISLFSKIINFEKISSRKLMLGGYFSMAFFMILMSLSIYFYTSTNQLTYAIMAMIFYLLFDTAGKFWTSGYLIQLRERTKNYSHYNDALTYRLCLFKHNKISVFGKISTYLLLSIFGAIINLYMFVVVISLIIILYGLLFYFLDVRSRS